ncbi:HD domain-containing protein [Nonomuraea turcica]|uniref:HD domain-containing protein n=1 Tax=Nonomuraea sp. G32 TaxID=3067274 RepID=UPI00273BFAFC|nr:HD domain-containing protein [Nonomuraea sp. G32]MDP4509193.1 HD domain-containing protein [Nonomuraea sp. G32]
MTGAAGQDAHDRGPNLHGRLQPVLDAAGGRLTGERLELVQRAHLVAAYWHRDQWRRSGDPYITHSIAVAAILAELGMDHELICAGLLHDVLDDTGCTEQELVAEFGEPVVELVRGLRTLDDPERRPPDWETSTDERVLTLKLADRLHNQRTMRFLPEEKQRRKALETLDVVVPIAGRLGLVRVEEELRRLSTATLSGRGGIRASFGVISAGAIMLPAGARGRWLEEWLGELHALPGRRARWGFAVRLIAGMPRLARTLRAEARRR